VTAVTAYRLPRKTMPTKPLAPISLACRDGKRVDVAPRWTGRALSVHAPWRENGETSRGAWAITAHAFGLSAGTFHGPLRDAIRLARLWDVAFNAALLTCDHGDGTSAGHRVSLRDWPHAAAWAAQLRGDAPATGPETAEPVRTRPRAETVDGDGAEQFPVTPTMAPAGPGRVRFARRLNDGRERLRNPETGKALRMNGDVAAFKGPNPLVPVLRLWWHGKWVDVPTIAECMEWSFDGVAETPCGSRVEPDAPDSWLILLGVI